MELPSPSFLYYIFSLFKFSDTNTIYIPITNFVSIRKTLNIQSYMYVYPYICISSILNHIKLCEGNTV